MRTTSCARDAAQRQRLRRWSEMKARRAAIRLLCCVSILRTVWTRVTPLAGSASWWVTALCLVPGAVVCLSAMLAMRLTRTQTLTDCACRCFGRMGGAVVPVLLSLLLVHESLSSLTALITMFTEGIGTRGTQITLAALTGGVLLFCLSRQGLPRAVVLLRPVMTGAALLIAAVLLPKTHADGLHPLWGSGEDAIRSSLRAGVSMGWPLLLLLTVPGENAAEPGRAALPVPAIVVPTVLLQGLVIPHELLIRRYDLAGVLLQLTQYAPTAVQTLHQCLLMLVLFLSVGISIMLLTEQICTPVGESPRWLPGLLLTAVTATQTIRTERLWRGLEAAGRWLLLPAALLCLLCLMASVIRRKGRI